MGLFKKFKHKKDNKKNDFLVAEIVEEGPELLEAELVESEIELEPVFEDLKPKEKIENSTNDESEIITNDIKADDSNVIEKQKTEEKSELLVDKKAEDDAVVATEKNAEKDEVTADNDEKQEKPIAQKPKSQAKPKTASVSKPKTVANSTQATDEPKTTASKFIIKKTDAGNFVFRLLAANRETIATSSQPYTSLTACKTGISSIQNIVETAGIEDQTLQKPVACANPKWEIYYDQENLFRFRLHARNGEIVAISSTYKSKASCKNGIKSICTNAPLAEVVRDDNHIDK